jgi:hypothetical protein
MILLDQFIAQTGKQPANWTSQDIQVYLDYIKASATEITALKNIFVSLEDLKSGFATGQQDPGDATMDGPGVAPQDAAGRRVGGRSPDC